MGREGARQGQALLLAAREPGRPAPLEPREAGLRERGRHAGPHRRPEPGAPLQAERDVVLRTLHDELAGRVLEDDPDAGGQGGGVGGPDAPAVQAEIPVESPRHGPRHEPGDRPGQRALARARRPHHQEAGAGSQVERDAGDGGLGATRVGDGDVAGDDGDGARVAAACGRRGIAQAAPPGKPSRTPAWRSARTRKSDPPPTMTTAEMAIRTPNRRIVGRSISGK